MSPAAVSGKNGRKLMHKLSKNVMKSYRFRIPKYDMPIRLRPVSITPLSHCLHLTRPPVVPRLHMRRYDRSRIAWFHEPRPAVERQAIALSMFLPCYRRVLFYHRRGRVSSRLLINILTFLFTKIFQSTGMLEGFGSGATLGSSLQVSSVSFVVEFWAKLSSPFFQFSPISTSIPSFS